MEPVDEFEDLGSGVFGADADVVHAAAVSQGDFAVGVDLVSEHSGVGVLGSLGAGAGLGSGVVGGGWGGPVRQGAVWSGGVVGLDEGVDEGLQLRGGGGLGGLCGEPLLEGLLEAFDLAAGGGVVGSGVLLSDVESAQFGL
nr:hypothetical protein [Knoellia sp. DB2414S]